MRKNGSQINSIVVLYFSTIDIILYRVLLLRTITLNLLKMQNEIQRKA